MAARKWTDEQRAEQSAKIHDWKPWRHSTGPTTSEGKATSSINACKGYWRRMARASRWLLRARYNNSGLTADLILEIKRRSDKLNVFTDEEFDHWLDLIKDQSPDLN